MCLENCFKYIHMKDVNVDLHYLGPPVEFLLIKT